MKKLKVIFIYFLDYLSVKKGLAQSGMDSYKYSLIKHINFLKENKVYSFARINKELINDYPAYLEKEGLKTRSIYGYLFAIKVFYRFMFFEGYVNENISSLIKTSRIDRRSFGHEKVRTRLFCKDCIDFRECKGKRWEECKYRDDLLKII